MQLPTVAQPVGMMISVPISIWLIKTVEKRTIMFVAIFGFAVYLQHPSISEGTRHADKQYADSTFTCHHGESGFRGWVGLQLYCRRAPWLRTLPTKHDLLFWNPQGRTFFCRSGVRRKVRPRSWRHVCRAGSPVDRVFPAIRQVPAGAEQLSPQVIDRLGFLWGPGFALAIFVLVTLLLRLQAGSRNSRENTSQNRKPSGK